jgi:hypothetical protein
VDAASVASRPRGNHRLEGGVTAARVAREFGLGLSVNDYVAPEFRVCAPAAEGRTVLYAGLQNHWCAAEIAVSMNLRKKNERPCRIGMALRQAAMVRAAEAASMPALRLLH